MPYSPAVQVEWYCTGGYYAPTLATSGGFPEDFPAYDANSIASSSGNNSNDLLHVMIADDANGRGSLSRNLVVDLNPTMKLGESVTTEIPVVVPP